MFKGIKTFMVVLVATITLVSCSEDEPTRMLWEVSGKPAGNVETSIHYDYNSPVWITVGGFAGEATLKCTNYGNLTFHWSKGDEYVDNDCRFTARIIDSNTIKINFDYMDWDFEEKSCYLEIDGFNGESSSATLITITRKSMNVTESIKWEDIVNNQTSPNEIFIGFKYLGIQNWNCPGNPPNIYPSAIFPETTFCRSFDKEVIAQKNPVTLYTDFSNPFIQTMTQPSGVDYQHFVKDMLKSEEFGDNMTPRLHLLRVANLGNPDNLPFVFSENYAVATRLLNIIKEKIRSDDLRTWLIGEIVFRGFTVTMDSSDSDGLLKDNKIDEKGLVYIKSMTYGSTGYFIVGSNVTYDDLKAAIITPNLVTNPFEKLSESSIFLITNSSPNQEATLSTTFDGLNEFIKTPYSNGSYGYPIYCTGCYIDDNSFFLLNINK